MVISENIPQELKALKRWVITRPIEETNAKGTIELRKPPLSPFTGELVHSVFSKEMVETDFGTFHEAVSALKRFDCTDVGLCFAGTDYRGFDYDKAIDKLPKENHVGHISLCDTYTEFSVSGKGFHAVLLSPGARDSEGATKRKYVQADGSAIEVFYEQYFVFTGKTVGPVCPIRKVSTQLFEQLCQAAKALSLKASEEIKPAATVRLRTVTKELLNRNVEVADSDDNSTIVSKALIALLFDTALDRELTEKLFKESALYKDTKWGREKKWERLRETEFKRAEPFARELLLKSRQRQSAKDKPQYQKQARVLSLDSIKPEVLRWLWPEKIPVGCLTLFAGMPGLGKSLMATDLIARGSSGRDFVDGTTNSHGCFSCLLLAVEDDKATVTIPRLMASGADLSKIKALDMIDLIDEEGVTQEERTVQLDSDLQAVRSVLEQDRSIKLVVIDPISNYMGEKNINSSQEFRDVLMPIAKLAQELDVAVIAVIHNTKQQGRDALSKIGGSISGIGVARIGWGFMQKDEEVKLMLLLKKNLGNFPGIEFTTREESVVIEGEKTGQAVISFIDKSKASIDNVIVESEADSKDKVANKCQDLIRKLVPKNGEVNSKIIIAAAVEAGLTERSIVRARSELGLVTHKKRDGWYWKWADQDAGDDYKTAASEIDFNPTSF